MLRRRRGERMAHAEHGPAGAHATGVRADPIAAHEALVQAVGQWVRDEATDADWEAFAAYEASLPGSRTERLVESRFLRWRLAR